MSTAFRSAKIIYSTPPCQEIFYFFIKFAFDLADKAMTHNREGLPLRAAYYTLGCKLNFAETSTIGKMLAERGVQRIEGGGMPDICIVNTCSVTEMADKKGRSLIRRLARLYPAATLVVTGCYAQLKPEEIASIEGVDIVLGSKEKHRITDFLDNWLSTRCSRNDNKPIVAASGFSSSDLFSPSCARGDRTRYFLKVQDGCDYYCTYCTIPFARGRSRSGSISRLVELAREAAEQRGKEIVLTGVNIGDFGKNTGENFFDLLKALDKVEGIERFRISSIEPNLLSEEIIEWVARESRAFMPHFHIPLQSGSDEVLRLMNRRYDTELFASRIEKIRSEMPLAFIGVDVIAGANGETEKEWERSYKFIESLDISRLHVFPYSERPGTTALHLANKVEKGERNRRAEKLIELSNSKLEEFMARNDGTPHRVLWEHRIGAEDRMTGLTDNYLRVKAPYDPLKLNSITELVFHAEN